MFSITITQTGAEDVIATLNRVARYCTDPITPVKAELVQWFRDVEARLFTSQGSSGASGRWPSLSSNYAAWKSRRYPGRTILERSGELRASLQVQTGHSIVQSSPGKLVLGTRVSYARFHHRGEGQKRRRVIDVTNRDAAGAMAIVRRRLALVVRQKVAA